MFESLSTRLQDVFKTLRGESRLTPENIEAALREIRLALLEADVNFKVVKAFIDRVRDRAMERRTVLARACRRRSRSSRSSATRWWRSSATPKGGLQPTTQAAARRFCCSACRAPARRRPPGKLAKWLTKQGRHPLLVSTDVKRPAAIQQLNVVGAEGGRARARSGGRDGSGGAREGRGGRGGNARVRRRDRRHRRPAAHRRRADGRAGRDQGRRPSRRICCTSPTR